MQLPQHLSPMSCLTGRYKKGTGVIQLLTLATTMHYGCNTSGERLMAHPHSSAGTGGHKHRLKLANSVLIIERLFIWRKKKQRRVWGLGAPYDWRAEIFTSLSSWWLDELVVLWTQKHNQQQSFCVTSWFCNRTFWPNIQHVKNVKKNALPMCSHIYYIRVLFTKCEANTYYRTLHSSMRLRSRAATGPVRSFSLFRHLK